MEYNQIYNLVNSANRQMWGENALAVHDLTGIIALGNTVFSSNTNRDGYLNVLVDRIGKTTFRNVDVDIEFSNFMKNEIEWGAIVQKINIQTLDAEESKAVEVGANGFTPNQFDITKPAIFQTLFTGASTFEYHVTIPDQLFKTAFTSESMFASFINGIMSAMYDSLVLAINNMNHLSLCNLIAEKIKANNGVVNLLDMYNDQMGESGAITAAEAYTSPEFYRYAGMILRNYIKYMSKPSKLYNVGINNTKMLRASKRDNLHVLINADFASGLSTYLTADTFNKDLAELPLYDEYVSLQGTGNVAPNFTDNTSIKIKPSSGGDAIEASGIVAVYADRQSIGTTYNDRFTAVDRNNRNRYTGYTEGATLNWFNDLSENVVVFLIAD